MVTVRDTARAQVLAHPVDPRRVGQHGLEIVMAVVRAFQVRLEPTGKTVTARIALSDGGAGTGSPRSALGEIRAPTGDARTLCV